MVRLTQKLATMCPYITSETIDCDEFPSLVRRYQVRLVPRTIINDRFAIDGGMLEGNFVERLLWSLEGTTAQPAAEPSRVIDTTQSYTRLN